MADRARRCREAYIVEALLEYLISLLVTGAFLAAILKQVGVSDAVTGVVSSIISLACVTQLFSGLLASPGRPVRRKMLVLGLVNQFMFSTLYLIPFIHLPHGAKTALFILMILGAYVIENLARPVKYKWLMTFVSPRERGRFTARKEIVSLIGGMLFTVGMGRMVDHFSATGRERTGFILCGATMFVVAVLYFLVLRSIDDDPAAGQGPQVSLSEQARALRSLIVENRAFRALLLADVVWKAAIYLATPYFGTYLIGELGFSLTAVSLIGTVSGLLRALVSPWFGRYADRRSWAASLGLGLAIAAAAFLANAFTRPGPARLLYAVYAALYAISMASINGGLMNITYDYIDVRLFAHAMGAKNAVSGVVGFLVSLLGGAVVRAVQARGSVILGHAVYAQQLLSAAAFLLIAGLALYVRLVIARLPRIGE